VSHVNDHICLVNNWCIDFKGSSFLCSAEEVSQCGEVLLHDKQLSRKHKHSELPESRVMSLASHSLGNGLSYVAAACSDALIR